MLPTFYPKPISGYATVCPVLIGPHLFI